MNNVGFAAMVALALRSLLLCLLLLLGGTVAATAADTDENAGIVEAVDWTTGDTVNSSDVYTTEAFENVAKMSDASGGVINMLVKLFNGPVMVLLCLLGGTMGIWGFFQSKQISSLYYGFGGVFAVVAFRLVLSFLT
jgi:hypothetical protein